MEKQEGRHKQEKKRKKNLIQDSTALKSKVQGQVQVCKNRMSEDTEMQVTEIKTVIE